MSARHFLDTNILLYSIDPRDPLKQHKAAQLIRDSLSSHKGVVSFQVVQEFFNVATKRLETSMSSDEAQAYLEKVFNPLVRVHSSMALYSEALAFQSRYQLSWYDSLMVCAALQAECKIFYSEDLQHKQRFGTLQIQNPFL